MKRQFAIHVAAAMALVAGAATCCSADAPGRPHDEAFVLEVHPVVRLAARDVVACGIGFTGNVAGVGLAGEFALTQSPRGPEFRLAVRAEDERLLTSVSLETGDASTSTLLPTARPEADGSLVALGPIPGFAGSDLVRSLMVSGGRLAVTTAEGSVLVATLSGPFAQQIRASYLNCAGDLERP